MTDETDKPEPVFDLKYESRALVTEKHLGTTVPAGTNVASVHVKIADVTGETLRKARKLYDLDSSLTKRQLADHVATGLAGEIFRKNFGDWVINLPERRMHFMTSHTPDAVTAEIWQYPPGKVTVNLQPNKAGKK